MTHQRQRRGFSLVELLVVIAIIAILVGILVPVVSSVRKAGREADVRQQVSTLAAACEQYRLNYGAYPGPLHNNQIGGTAPGTLTVVAAAGFAAPATINLASITMAENLTLGLLGGMVDATNYNPSLVGNGPKSLLATNVRQFPALVAGQNLSWNDAGAGKTGHFIENVGTAAANDTIIPEFVDRFTDPMPILYLRARVGANPANTDAATNPIMTNNTRNGQYDITQIDGYTLTNIGIGKDVRQSDYVNATYPNHGLRSVTFGRVLGPKLLPGNTPNPDYEYPFNAYAYFRHPTISNTARQKDAFILISAGTDRVYGTTDDICNFGAVSP